MADSTVHKGVLKTWKDDRGFGFIQPDNGDKDIFIHISSLKGIARRPLRGDVIVYRVAREADGKLKAVDASIEGVAQTAPSKPVKFWRWLVALLLGLISAAAAAYFYR